MLSNTLELPSPRTCPRCGATYRDHPALSRRDNRTSICPDCGVREALESLGVPEDEQDHILQMIHRSKAR